MLDKYMVSYNYEESIIHNLNPMVKIITFIFFVVSCFFKFDLLIFISSLVWIFFLIMLSNISIKKYLKVIWNYKYILLLIYFILRSSIEEMMLVNVIFFKIVFCLLYFYLILFTTTRKDFVNCLSEIFGFCFNKKKVAKIFDNLYCFVYYFVEEINEDDEINSIKGEDRVFKGFITRGFIYANNLKNYVVGSKIRVDSINKSKDSMLYNDSYYSKYRYRSKLNVFDYILILFFILIYVYYIIKVR